MLEKSLAVLQHNKVAASAPTYRLTRLVSLCVGVSLVLIGAANVLSLLSGAAFGSEAVTTAFAPAVVALRGDVSPVGTTTPLVPTRLVIPAIHVSADVEPVGRKADGSMATPSTFDRVGWYSLGSKPGEAGNAVIDGHVNNALTRSGVFEHLSDLVVGDTVMVSDTSGRTLTYVIDEVASYPTDQAPIDTIFNVTGPSKLVLITCDGSWDPAAHSFNKRFVVYASLR